VVAEELIEDGRKLDLQERWKEVLKYTLVELKANNGVTH
jgi:hypothetical protein